MTFITLRILDGADRGRAFEDLPIPVTIGREEGNTIQLNDERVSRFHIKIQEDHDKLVLTDLESTNGTKVNGEDIQLRILRHGDVISVGRSVLLFGSREEIARRLGKLRESKPNFGSTMGSDDDEPTVRGQRDDEADVEANWSDDLESQGTMHVQEPPELPEHLSPSQAAQVAELLGYIHLRIRELLDSVKFNSPNERIAVDYQQWQNLLDIQSRLADYLRAIGNPPEPEE